MRRWQALLLAVFAGSLWSGSALAVAAGAPPAPTGLTLALDPRGVALSWDHPPPDATAITGYEIVRATSAAGPFETVGRVKKGIGHFLDTTAAAENIYYYKVRALSDAQPSEWSAPVTGERPAIPGQ